ncbi:aminotransferase class IV [Negadavirga shengliensis]|uniref:branched-chain-amino-acid transaminase n=1 Tax=Negadavirga shengliensis TaxID=1389218 RepID=A0ABV9T2Q0_9BACT
MTGFETVFLQKAGATFLAADVAFANRAAFFGDGIFETMVFAQKRIRFADAHQKRAKEGMDVLKLRQNSVSSVQQIEEYVRKNFPADVPLRIRWNIYREGIGKYTPTTSSPQETLFVQPFSPAPAIKNKAYVSESVHVCPSPWSHCKTLNGLTYVMANMERQEKGMDEVILTDDKGFISEAGSANIFWVKNGKYYTPSLKHNAIAGVSRAMICEILQKKGKLIQEGSYTFDDLLGAEQVFTSNVSGLSYIQRIDEKMLSTDPIPFLEALFTW